MITTVKNWSIVTIKDDLSPFQVLWAVVEHDSRKKLKQGHYVCSSRILYIEDNHVRTHTGSSYELAGEGSEYVATYVELISLMDGFSPTELNLEAK